MNKFIKQNWFVVVVACLFVIAGIYFAYDQNKDKLPGKNENGAGVVLSIGDENITADELYEKYSISSGSDITYMLMQRALLDQVVKTTSDLKDEANTMAEQYQSYYESQYGTQANDVILANLLSLGLDNLYDYCLYNLKLEEMYREYIKAHIDEIYTPFAAEYQPRLVSHVLVSMDNPDKPTAEETKRFNEVKEAWASDKYSAANFGEFAADYSDDTASALEQGSIGYTDKNSSLVAPFLKAALALKEGEVSDWVKTEYGYHLIMVTSTKLEDVIDDVSFLESVLNYDSTLEGKITWSKLQEVGVTFADENTEKEIKEALHIDEDTNAEESK